jgi:chromosome segregation ATPase
LEPLKEKIATIEEAMKQYEDTLQETEDLAEQTAENIREELDTKLAAIDYSVEVQIEVNDFKLKVLENLIKKLNDDLWDGEERVANLTK